MVAQWPLPPCEENPMPFTINFYTDDAGQPGAIVASRWATLTGVEGETYNWMYSHVSYEYNVAFTQPVLLDHGWISIVGGEAADTTCHFYWLASPTGDGVHWLLDDVTPPYTYEQRDDDLSFCLTTDCPEADSLVLHHTTGNMFILSFWAPIDANYKFYYTTSTTAEYPTGFSLASQLSLTAGHGAVPAMADCHQLRCGRHRRGASAVGTAGPTARAFADRRVECAIGENGIHSRRAFDAEAAE